MTSTGKPWRVAIIGAGTVASVHAAVLAELPNARLVAVVDPVPSRARALADAWDVERQFRSVDELIAAGGVDAAHVAVPPPHHMPIACQILSAGIPALIEKPLAQSAAECRQIDEAASAAGTAYAVNHNFLWHPAHRRARETLRRGHLGPLRHVSLTYNMPLAQLTAGQLGHWMFDGLRNLLLEQAVHPLSQIADLIGLPNCLAATALSDTINGTRLARKVMLSLGSERATAQLHFAVGESYPVWTAQLVCSDGALLVDYVNNRVGVEEARSRPEAIARLHNGLRLSAALLAADLGNAAAYVLSTLRIRRRSDPYYISMRDSIAAFYQGLRDATVAAQYPPAAALVELCCEAAERAGDQRTSRPGPPTTRVRSDIAVIGGTGFIGRHVVRALLQHGDTVAVLARGRYRLPDDVAHPALSLHLGDAAEVEDLRRVLAGARKVIMLATPDDRAPPGDAADAVEAVAEICLELGIERLVYLSSIAALDTGDRHAAITGDTATDPRIDRRAGYARAKAQGETILRRLHRERGLPLCILRPGVVIGEDGPAFHGAVGFFHAERHVFGWNRGDNPLPFVLATDVAIAAVAALNSPDAVGKCYNLVGDVRLTAAEYIAELARALGRPLRFHRQSVVKVIGIEFAKSLLKAALRRPDPWTAAHDIRARGLTARFDCNDAKRDLGWAPVSDRAAFLRLGIEVHAPAAPIAR